MTLRITCPGCQAPLTFNDDKRGRKVRCRECTKAFSIPAEDEPEDEDRPVKKKKKKRKKGAPAGLLIAGVAVVAVVLIGVASGSAYFLLRNPEQAAPKQLNQQAKLEEKDKQKKDDAGAANPPPVPMGVPIVPGIEEGNPAKKGGGSILSNVRGAGYRTERRNELKQIGTFFVQFCDSTPKSARTKENFLTFIQRDAKAIHDAIADGYYQMNLRADIGTSGSVIAYESDIDRTGHLCVMGDTSVDYVPLQVLKEALAK